jgi:hypothetical protein
LSSVSDKENPTVHLVLIVMPRKTIKKKAVSTVEKTDEAQAVTASPLEQLQEGQVVTTPLTGSPTKDPVPSNTEEAADNSSYLTSQTLRLSLSATTVSPQTSPNIGSSLVANPLPSNRPKSLRDMEEKENMENEPIQPHQVKPKTTDAGTRERLRELHEYLSSVDPKLLFQEKEWRMSSGPQPDEANLPTNTSNPLSEMQRWAEDRVINPPTMDDDRLHDDQEAWCFNLIMYEGLEPQGDARSWTASYLSKIGILLKYLSKYVEQTTRRARHQIRSLESLKRKNEQFVSYLAQDWQTVVQNGNNYAYVLLCAMLASGVISGDTAHKNMHPTVATKLIPLIKAWTRESPFNYRKQFEVKLLEALVFYRQSTEVRYIQLNSKLNNNTAYQGEFRHGELPLTLAERRTDGCGRHQDKDFNPTSKGGEVCALTYRAQTE